ALGLAASFGVHSRPAAAKETPFPWLGPISSVKELFSICADRQMLTAFVADNFFYFLATIVVLTINTFGLGQLGFSQTATSLLSMSLMLGICIGSFIAARLVKMEQWSGLLYPSASGMAAGLFLAGATVFLPASLHYPWLAAALTGTGIFGGLFLIPVASFLQVRPADAEKGRVLATVNFSGFIGILLANCIFFGPRRQVTMELVEDTILPGLKGRQQINAHLEHFYNAERQANTHVSWPRPANSSTRRPPRADRCRKNGFWTPATGWSWVIRRLSPSSFWPGQKSIRTGSSWPISLPDQRVIARS
ncbi:MAG: Major facilitator superfamily MFS_1, partial [uncultured bacterium]